MKFELLPNAAKHLHRTPLEGGGYSAVMVNPGEVVETDEDLVTKFPNKFRAYGEAAVKEPVNKPQPNKPSAPQGEQTAGDQSQTAGDTTSTTEEDVTANFAEASGTGLRVLKKGNKFIVVDSDGESVTNGAVARGAAVTAIVNYADANAEG